MPIGTKKIQRKNVRAAYVAGAAAVTITAIALSAAPAVQAAPVAAPTALTVGSYKPTASTTGVPAGTALKPYNTSGADLVITKDGTILDGLDIYGDIKVRAKNVAIKNSRLHGGKAIPGKHRRRRRQQRQCRQPRGQGQHHHPGPPVLLPRRHRRPRLHGRRNHI